MEPAKPTRVGVPAVPVSGLKAGAPPKPGVKPVRPGKATSGRPSTTSPVPPPTAAGSTRFVPDADDATGVSALTTDLGQPSAVSGPPARTAPKPTGKAPRPTGKRGR
jgi:hypothetical protein